MHTLVSIRSLSKRFKGVVALSEFSCTVEERQVLGLLGPNGAGKTTLFNVLTGLLAPDDGAADFKGCRLIGVPPHRIAKLGIARTFQNLRLIQRLTTIENILLCMRNQPGEHLLNVWFRPGLSTRFEALNRERANELARLAGMSEKADILAGNLSYGEQKLLSLLCCVAADADLLLLDEPVAGIAPQWAERILAIIADLPSQGKAAVVIEHDIDALRGIAERMVFMDSGRIVCEGTPEQVLSDARVIEAYLE